jgi:putative molybdopterin biosynthesis protein
MPKETPQSSVENHLLEIRRRRGLSAATVASLMGVSRQTIYAVEAGTYMPNTALALRLAELLEVTVEELFRLPRKSPPARATARIDFVLGGRSAHPGQPLQLCRVGTKTIAVPSAPAPAYLPAADGVFGDTLKGSGSNRAAVLFSEEPARNRVLIAGCDPAMSVFAAHAAKADVKLILGACNSSQALHLLKKRQVHIAGAHLRDYPSGDSNLPAVRKLFPRRSVSVMTFAVWQEGLVVSKGNGKKIRSIADLSRADVEIVNREPGAGSRILLDHELKKAGVRHDLVRGYGRTALGHLSAAWHVMAGLADCCIATEAASRAFGLDFIPLASEQYDLIVRREFVDLPAIQSVLETMQRSALRRDLELLGGYDTVNTGDMRG